MIFLNAIEAKKSTVLKGVLWTLGLLYISAFGFKFFYTVIDPSLSASNKFIISRIIFWLWLLTVYLYAVNQEKQRFLLWPENHHSIGFIIVSVFLTLLIIFIGALIVALTLRHIGLNEYSKAANEIKYLTTPVKLVGVITAACVEEFIFRGYLIPRLCLLFENIHFPILISTVFFALGHIGYGTVFNVVGPFFIGIVFAYHYYKYRDIKILIICHFIIDYIALIVRH